MTPEERKAIVMRPGKKWSIADLACERLYPKCCNYHEGFDDALGLLEAVGWIGVKPEDEPGEWYFHYEDENADEPEYDKAGCHISGYEEVRTVFAIEPARRP